eukprot:m.25247 g.25247  ORF g.25247 m.25247 type:complete len:155 (-) comp14922_c0_seq1:90-554(-)
MSFVEGKKICFTGALNWDMDWLHSLTNDGLATCIDTCSDDCDILVTGADTDAETMESAKKIGATVWTEKEFIKNISLAVAGRLATMQVTTGKAKESRTGKVFDGTLDLKPAKINENATTTEESVLNACIKNAQKSGPVKIASYQRGPDGEWGLM